MSDKRFEDPYCYPPDYKVLRNREDIRDANRLKTFEHKVVMAKLAQGIPAGNFDLDHLKTIHAHLFRDVYEWAGEIRTVAISKKTGFLPHQHIPTAVDYLHKELKDENFLRALNQREFVDRASYFVGELNHIHPFRDGNGRTQTAWFALLAKSAGYVFDPARLKRDEWISAFIKAHDQSYTALAQCIDMAIRGEKP